MRTLQSKRILALLIIPVVLVAAAVFGTATRERDVAVQAGDQQQLAQLMLTAMLDQETGARGYFQTGDPRFLEPFSVGANNFRLAVANASTQFRSEPALERLLGAQRSEAAAWQNSAQTAITAFARTRRRPTIVQALDRKSLMDAFRASNASFARALEARRNSRLAAAETFGVGIAGGIAALLAVAGILLWRTIATRDSLRALRHNELGEMLQVSDSEEESRELLVRHIAATIPRSAAAVLNRNNSDDRLEPTLGPGADTGPLRAINTDQLRPRSCMAVRLNRTYGRDPGDPGLMSCEICGKIAGSVACEPLLVGGKVIGSVLVATERKLTGSQRGEFHDSVSQAAPILANQRNLAVAETRAASDQLTGLPNRRAADETLKRMLAHASRTMTSLAAVLVDLDHFKDVNDTLGHEGGDRILAAVGQALMTGVRTSDFASRYGGEEFLVLLPDTDRTGALIAAEKLRIAISQIEITGLKRITASLGIAVMPDDAVDGEHLLRKADRALYAAKSAGRNRVEIVESANWPMHGELAPRDPEAGDADAGVYDFDED